MKRTTFHCDSCGKELKQVEVERVTLPYRHKSEYKDNSFTNISYKQFDLCRDCAIKYYQWVFDNILDYKENEQWV